MNYMNTRKAAEHMLENKKYYTAATLAKELDIPAKTASGYLYNIRHSKTVTSKETPLPGRTVMVTEIKGHFINNQNLWRLAFGLRTATAG